MSVAPMLPPVLVSHAIGDEGRSQVSAGPIRALSWSKVPPDCATVTQMIWVSAKTLPEAAAKRSLSKPAGMAGIFLRHMATELFRHREDYCRDQDGSVTEYSSPWPEKGIQTTKHHIEWFFRRYQAAGGRLDWLILDYEGGYTVWHRKRHHIRAIWNDPRGATLADEIGTTNINRVVFRRGDDYLKWNAVMGKLVCRALNAAIFNPVKNIIPDVKSCNYGAYVMSRENVVPDLNGYRQFLLAHCGTHGSASFYGRIGKLAGIRLDGKRPYGRSPFAVLRLHVNRMRAIKRSSDVPFMPWVSHKTFPESVFQDNDYYQELIYHLALSGVDGFLYWNPHPWKAGQDPSGWADEEQDRLFHRCLASVNERLNGPARRCATLDAIEWDSALIVTGMRVGDRRVLWRITARPGVTRVQVVPSGQTIELAGRVGLWYESPEGPAIQFKVIE